jgi:plastocyanin
MTRRWGLAAALAGALMLAACGGRSAAGAANKPATGPAQDVTIKGADTMRFDPATLTVKAGTPVHLTMDDAGAVIAHDFTIDSVGGQKVQVKPQPNGRASGDFTAPTAGTFQFYCSEPGHKEAGMVGTLTVTG